MTAGLNVWIKIERDYKGIDAYGGAYIASGTVLAQDIHARIDYGLPRTMITNAQGYEVEKNITVMIKPIEVPIYSEDRIVITKPISHLEYLKHFRILGVENTSIHPRDRRGFLTIGAVRIEPYRSGTFPNW